MRISDWSSDVCSSDLLSLLQAIVRRGADAGPADREGAVVVRGRRRQRWWIGGWMRHHSSLDRRECRATTGIAGTNPVLITAVGQAGRCRSEEHTSELQSLMRLSYAVFCLKKKKKQNR